MKTRNKLYLIAAVLSAAFSAMYAAEQQPNSAGYHVSKVSVRHWDPLFSTTKTEAITQGTKRATVAALLGRPSQTLSPDVLLYDNCQPDQAEARDQGCTSLLVVLDQDRVTDLRFVSPSTIASIAASLQGHELGNSVNKTAVAEPNR